MPRTLQQVYEETLAALQDALTRLSSAVPMPVLVTVANGQLAYRYAEQTYRPALVLKVARKVSAVIALKTLLDAGLILDAGAIMRILDELGSDILFLAGPTISGSPPEPRHTEYLDEFFQEEFDHADPLQSTQSRRRVSRRDIRAYVARTYSAGLPVSRIVAVNETIDNAFSGYIHGAAAHIFDTFDGRQFCIPADPRDRPVLSLRSQIPMYLHRALMDVAIASRALNLDDLFAALYQKVDTLFDPEGRLR